MSYVAFSSRMLIGQRKGLSNMDAKQANLLYENCGKEYTHLYHKKMRLREQLHPLSPEWSQSLYDSNCGFPRKIMKYEYSQLNF